MWFFENNPYTAISDKRLLGFVYRIDNITNGRSYIGQRTFYTRKGKCYTENDWRNYTGSNKALNLDIEAGDQITKTIIRLCRERNEMNYHEAKAILEADALLDDRFYNEWIKATITGKGSQKWSDRDQKHRN